MNFNKHVTNNVAMTEG